MSAGLYPGVRRLIQFRQLSDRSVRKAGYNDCTMNAYVKVPGYVTPEESVKLRQQNRGGAVTNHMNEYIDLTI